MVEIDVRNETESGSEIEPGLHELSATRQGSPGFPI